MSIDGPQFPEPQSHQALIDQIEGLIQAAFIRAACAVVFNKLEAARIALYQRWTLLSQLADLEGTAPPKRYDDPREFFKKWDWANYRLYRDDGDGGPEGNAFVPRKPLPNPIAGERALPLPKK
jgi:hypothetical protein